MSAPNIDAVASGAAAPVDHWYWSADGLRLHWQEWPGPTDRPALLCIPGLTRTAADFGPLAAALKGRFRVLGVDLRGRGDSAYAKDPLSYVPLTYLIDMGRLIEAAGLTRFVALGNSLGGLVAMQLARGHRAALAGVVLNDIGPDIAPEGLARMRANVGRTGSWPTWLHAARDLEARNSARHPGWTLHDWLAFAHRLCRVSGSGRIVFDYDPRIAEPFRLPHNDAGLDLWLAFEALAGLPVLSLRGALSDTLAAETQAAMARRLPGLVTATVPGVGNAPLLDEPEALAALLPFLERLSQTETQP